MHVRRLIRLFALAAFLATFGGTASAVTVTDPGFTSSQYASGLTSATCMAWAPGSSNRLFVTIKTGAVRVIKNGALLGTPFATLSPIFTSSECGLLSVCFDPNFASNGYVYFFITVSNSEQQIVRYTASGDVGINKVIIKGSLPTKGANHDGGGISIGPDNKLYWAIGNNGNGLIPGEGNERTTLVSKVGRANLDGSAPTDNPYYSATDGITARDYIWASGFRNPFTQTWQPGTNKLWVNVVGDAYEQAFLVNRDDDVGGRSRENVQVAPYIRPKISYRTNGGVGGCITGGCFYDKTVFPTQYRGNFFYGEFNLGRILRATFDSANNVTSSNTVFASGITNITDTIVGPDSALYALSYGGGQIYRIAYNGGSGNLLPTVSITAPASGSSYAAPATIAITANAADADGTVSRVEFFQGATLLGTDTTSPYGFTWSGAGLGNYTLTARATDNAGGMQTSGVVSVTVTAPPPAAPANLTATAGNAQVSLAWSASTNATVYYLERATVSGGPYTTIASPTTTSYLNLALTNGTTYYYVVSAANSAGQSANSAQKSATPSGAVDAPPTVRLTAPINGATVSGTNAEFFGDGVDDLGCTKAEFFVDGVLKYTDVNSQNHFHMGGVHNMWNTTALSNGTHTVMMTVYDTKGQKASQQATVTVNNSSNPPPVVSIANPTNGATVAAGTNLYVLANASDANGSIANVKLYVNNQLLVRQENFSPYEWSGQNDVLLQNMTAGTYALKAVATDNAGAMTTSSVVTITVTGGSQNSATGLTGQYFDNSNFTGATFSRTDAMVNFNWGLGSPASSMVVDTFSVRWTGQVQAQHSQTYTFHVTGDDGVRLWVNGRLLIDKWILQPATEWSGSIALTAGNKYDISLEYFENALDAVAQLRWSSASTPKAIIPTSQLYPLLPIPIGSG